MSSAFRILINRVARMYTFPKGKPIFIKLLWETEYLALQEKAKTLSHIFLINASCRKNFLSRNSVVSLCIGSSCPQTCNKNQSQSERERPQGAQDSFWGRNLQDGAWESAYSTSTQASLVSGRTPLHPDEWTRLSHEEIRKKCTRDQNLGKRALAKLSE